jgi:succinoglycan biosynthesis protein ExoA
MSTSGPDLVTVAIPARDEADHIGACLDSVLAQTHTQLQVFVVDGGSHDDTVAIVCDRARRDHRVRLLRNDGGPIPRSLNMAVAEATGRWLVRVDAHSTVPPDYVERAVKRLTEGCWGGVGGRKDGYGETSAGRAIAAAMNSRFGVGNSFYHHATTVREVDHIPFGAYPLDVVRRLGGWDEELVANEDFEFDYRLRRAGMSLLLDPGMTIRWRSRQSLRELHGQYRRYGRGKVDVARRHPKSLQPRHLMPPALVAYLAVAALVALRRPARSLLMVSPYAAALAVAVARSGRQLSSRSDRAKLPAAFLAMHIGWGIGFWESLLFGFPRPHLRAAASAPAHTT